MNEIIWYNIEAKDSLNKLCDFTERQKKEAQLMSILEYSVEPFVFWIEQNIFGIILSLMLFQCQTLIYQLMNL